VGQPGGNSMNSLLKVIDNEKQYSLGEWGDCLLVQDLEDCEDVFQVDYQDFSLFEKDVFKFLVQQKELTA
jgi:hypothetical protein